MSPIRGILFKLGAVTAFMVMASLVKATAEAVPPGQAVFFRSFFAFPVLFGWLALRGELRTGLKAKHPISHVWRGLVGTSAMAFGFAGLGLLPLPEVTALRFASPIFVVVLAALMLGERIRLFRTTAVLVGLLGVVVVLWPRLGGVADLRADTAALGAIFCLLSAGLAALAHVFIRKMVATETTSAIVFYFTITSTSLSLLTVPFGWVWPSPTVAALLIAAGLCGGAGQIMLTSAYRYAPASVVAPFDYASMLLALIVGYFIFAEVPTVPMLAGALLVMASGVAIIWRERQLALARGKARPMRPD
ncbi:DMT family transporter [Dinoroseobacter sp. S124A]|uniref:DMT family transporter n=1 Tax=Dinoroseobacter sp. S124A TaxID=3415128 RepID=UPI003C7E8AE9